MIHVTERAKEVATRLSDQVLLLGLGWLAREGKVTLVRRPRGLEASLRESAG
jgi:hypothetical protein